MSSWSALLCSLCHLLVTIARALALLVVAALGSPGEMDSKGDGIDGIELGDTDGMERGLGEDIMEDIGLSGVVGRGEDGGEVVGWFGHSVLDG